MKRSARLCVLLVLGATGVLAAAVLVAPAQDKPTKPPGENKSAVPLAAKLQQPVDFPGIEADPKATLEEVLAKLTKDYGLKFDVNESAFKEEQVEDPLAKPVIEREIRKMSHVPLGTVVRKVIERLPSATGTTYTLRDDTIEVTTRGSVIREIWGDAYRGPFLPLVNATIDKQPLDEALKELSAVTEFNIVLDTRAGESAKVPVSAKFVNVPVDTAVRLLADMAELKPFLVDNVLYVTTAKRAEQMEAREKQKLSEDDPNNPGPRIGRGRWFQPVNAPGGA
jgi:hypothetical protein